MLRFAVGMLASGAVLLTSAAVHVLASWALPLAAISLMVGAIVAVVAMEASGQDIGLVPPARPISADLSGDTAIR